jgi:hypothetical protein
MSKGAWLKLLFDNRRSILSLAGEGISTWRRAKKRRRLESNLATNFDREQIADSGRSD